MLWIHIGSGLLAIVAGFIALYARKGGRAHVGAGRAFAVAMVTMTTSAALIAGLLRPNPGNTVAALMTLYLVATAWLALRAGPERTRRTHVALAALAAGLCVYDLAIFRIIWTAPGRVLDGIPAAMLLFFAVVMLTALVGDVRALRRGGVVGPGRILRHLWRMTFALWIATSSFFLGQADEFPLQVRQSGLLLLPVLAVTATFLFWVLRQGWAVWRSRRRAAAPARAIGPVGAG